MEIYERNSRRAFVSDEHWLIKYDILDSTYYELIISNILKGCKTIAYIVRDG